MKKDGILIIVSGFSGAGKGTVMERFLEKYADEFCLSVSATTRQPRAGEVDGVHYFFKSRAEFEHMIENGELFEYAQYVGNYYGTPKAFVDSKLAEGFHVLLEIEMQGALKVKKERPDALLIFITPPDAASLERRLRGRGTETEEVIAQRLARACEESVYMKDYDYIVINQDNGVEACADTIRTIVQSEQLRTQRSGTFIKTMTEDLKRYKKGD
ncbi:MAG TPA: guanylate kinase [Candidatus Scybalocola faecipullorum]|nr:guanylate kinase [Candidatus Scybalocola faecipullorum]